MSTKISTVYPVLVSLLGTLFPTKTRIPYANDIQNNTDLFLRDGYGIWVEDVTLPIYQFNNYTCSYNIPIVLTKEIIHKDNDITNYDSGILSLLEDMNTLVKRLHNPDQIGQEANIENITVENVTPIQTIITENKKFFSITISLRLEITESI